MLAGPTIRRRRLGTDLRRLREQSSLRLEEVAQHLGVAPSTLSRIETGKAPTRTSYLALMLDLYGVDDPEQRRLFMDSAREGQRKGWWAGSDELLPAGTGTYLGLEAEARALRAFQAQVVPELMRTEAYARAVVTASRPELAPEQVDRVVAVQLRRQEVLQGSDPIQLRLVLDESVLLRSLGPASVMREQLERLIRAGSQPMATIQVLGLAAAERPVLAGSFGILSFAEPDDHDVAYAEGIRGQVLLEQRESEVHAMRLMFDALSRSARSPRESARLIRELAPSL
ncbi:MAG TPA: helix-turn-helix transcriptional regulator [Streptosporangiaceae bacterium]|nr:helix-turn-helix transcriptional regulator [Streptosporangiaceae bacterium]